VSLDLDALIQPLDPLPASGPQNPPPRPRQPLWWRLGQLVSAYLPLLLMALLALVTWWLEQNTPRIAQPGEKAAPRHEPDYLMERFTMQRFGAEGRMRVQLQGAQMRHYPDTDTYEIDGVTIRAEGGDGRITIATAQRASCKAPKAVRRTGARSSSKASSCMPFWPPSSCALTCRCASCTGPANCASARSTTTT
jgi:lipopolysaccharide export system protein LptC